MTNANWNFMSCRLIFPIIILVLSGCHFDSSTSNPSSSEKEDQTGDPGPESCEGFAAQACGDCGTQVCVDRPEGAWIGCSPSAQRQGCGTDATCNSEGYCQSQDPEAECLPSNSRSCGDCGIEYCQAGSWSGDCREKSDNCGWGSTCFPDGSEYDCKAACSTEGYRTPRPDSSAIPDIKVFNAPWESIDNCLNEDEYKTCRCEVNFITGEPEVKCDACAVPVEPVEPVE
jgi:hypothetical protein